VYFIYYPKKKTTFLYSRREGVRVNGCIVALILNRGIRRRCGQVYAASTWPPLSRV